MDAFLQNQIVAGVMNAAPLIVMLIGAITSLMVVVFARARTHSYSIAAGIVLGAFACAFALAWRDWLTVSPHVAGMLSFDRLSFLAWMLISMAGAFVTLLSTAYLPEGHHVQAEYYPLLLFSAFGLAILVASANLITLIVGLETASLAAYTLAGIMRFKTRGNEAALKYFLTGSFALAFLVMGAAFLFGAVGSLGLDALTVRAQAVMTSDTRWFFMLGCGLVLAGLGFKIAAAPFHAWAPDVYDGAPTPITAFIASAMKVGGIVILVRIAVAALGAMGDLWIYVSMGLAIITMTLGNIAALTQENIKRLLAYSSIAHVGYMLVAMPAMTEASPDNVAPILFYLTAYVFMTIGAFAVIVALSEGEDEHNNIASLAGLGRRRPALAAALALFLIALAGVPPTIGFFAKYYLFLTAVRNGYAGLVIVAMLNSAVSLYYYLKPVVVMYFHEGRASESEGTLERMVSPALVTVILLCTLAVAFFGILPANLMTLIRQSV